MTGLLVYRLHSIRRHCLWQEGLFNVSFLFLLLHQLTVEGFVLLLSQQVLDNWLLCANEGVVRKVLLVVVFLSVDLSASSFV